MKSSNLKSFLADYEIKRITAEKDAEYRKSELYKKIPRLQEIDDELSRISISAAKSLINSNSSEVLNNLSNSIAKLKKEKNEILLENVQDEKYLLPRYKCSGCNDTGYIKENYNTVMCNCLKQKIFNLEYNKSNIYNLEKQNFNSFNELFYSEEINEEKYNSISSPRQNIKLIKDACISFIDNFDYSEEKNLLFTGNTGLGKTFLSSCIANELIKRGKTVLYQTSSVMLDTIIDYKFNKSINSKNIYDNLLNVDLLIIDDLGTENTNNMVLTELFNIINTRLLNQNKITKTIISTNLSLNNLFNIYDERIVSRLIGNYNIYYFFGDDIRIKNK